MFIRIKKIKGHEYAYLVQNTWQDNKARQKVMRYLGKVWKLEKVNNCSFEEFCEKEKKEPQSCKEIISVLMQWSLYQYGFEKDPLIQRKWIFNNGKIVGDPEKLTITSGKKEVTLKINEGYMNTYSLDQVLHVNLQGKEQRVAGTELAHAFINAGIQVPQEVFIEVFQQVYK